MKVILSYLLWRLCHCANCGQTTLTQMEHIVDLRIFLLFETLCDIPPSCSLSVLPFLSLAPLLGKSLAWEQTAVHPLPSWQWLVLHRSHDLWRVNYAGWQKIIRPSLSHLWVQLSPAEHDLRVKSSLTSVFYCTLHGLMILAITKVTKYL